MDLALPESERTYLRELAARQAEDRGAAGDGSAQAAMVRSQRWPRWRTPSRDRRDVDLRRDFIEGIFRCTSELGRGIEHQLLRNIRNRELIDDDKVIPDTFDYGWSVTIDELGVRIPQRAVKDAQGYETGYGSASDQGSAA